MVAEKMRTVKFIGQNPREKLFGVEVRKRVNAYLHDRKMSPKGGWAIIVKAIVMLGIYIAPFVLLLTGQFNVATAFLLVMLMGIGEAGVGMSVMHDAAHGAFSSRQWVNKLFGSSMYLLGSNTLNWKIQHNVLHHTYTNIYGFAGTKISGFDEDIETKAVIRLCDHAPLKKYHQYQHIYAFFLYGLMTLSKLVTDFSQLLKYNRAGMTRDQKVSETTELLKLAVGKIIYLTIIIGLPFMLTAYAWWQILIGFAIMHITAGMIMGTVFQMAHVVEGATQPLPNEQGVIQTDWAVHEIQATSDFARNNLLLNWYIGGLNFQIEHHLFPHVSHIHYRSIAPVVEQTVREFNFAYNLKPTFLKALASHARRLRELGRWTPEREG
jgi:linoleoyl-CoA desaturase